MRSVSRFGQSRNLMTLTLAVLLFAVFPLGCSREQSTESSSYDEGTQVAENERADQEPSPPAEEAAPPAYSEPPQAAAPPQRPRTDSSTTSKPSRPPSAPAPAPAPQTVAYTLSSGTELKVKLEDALDSGTTQPGDHFASTLVDQVIVGDRVVLPAGSRIDGTVTDVVPAKKGIKESGGSLTLSFERVTTTGGESVPLSASISRVAKSTKKKAGTIAGSAAGGALLGKILGGSTKDAAVGAVVGGAIGTGVAAGTKGTEMKLEAGTQMTITLDQPMTLHLRR